MTGRRCVYRGSVVWLGNGDASSMLPRYVQRGVGRAMIDNQDFVAGVQGFEGPPEARGIVEGMEDGRDGGHLEPAS